MQRRQFLQAVPASLGAASLAVSRPSFARSSPKAPTKQPVCLQRLTGHQGPVKGVEPLDDRRLLSWSSDGTMRLWDGRKGEAGPVLRSAGPSVRGLAFLGWDRLLTWDRLDGAFWQWDLANGRAEHRIETDLRNLKGLQALDEGRALAWGSNGLCIIGDGGVMRLFDGQRGTPWGAGLRGVNPGLQGVQLLEDGRILSWSSRGGMRLWDGRTGEPGPVLATHGIARAMALPGNRLLTWGREGFRFWDTPTLKAGSPIPSDIGWLRDAAPLPNGRVAAWDYDGRLRILPDKPGRTPVSLDGHSEAVWGAIPLPGKRLLSWSEDGTLRIWDILTGRQKRALQGHRRRVKGATILSSGEILSWSSDRTLRVWNPRSGQCQAVLTGHGRGVLGAREWGRKVVSWSGDAAVAVWRI